MPDDSIVVADVGQNQIWTANNYQIKNGKFMTTGGMGTMGYSLAAAMGAKVRIQDFPGYWPRNYYWPFVEVFGEAMSKVMPFEYKPTAWGTGCSDMGDICAVMPAIHPYVGGSSGTAHSVSYKIIDADMACVGSAKGQLLALKALLENDAQKAKQILAEVKPVMESKEAYFAFVDKLDMDKRTVTYQENGTVTLDFTN